MVTTRDTGNFMEVPLDIPVLALVLRGGLSEDMGNVFR